MSCISVRSSKTRRTIVGLLVTGMLVLLGLLGWGVVRWLKRPTFRLINLSAHYNTGLTNSMLNYKGNTLAEFSAGTNRFGGVPFAVGGVIQLGNHNYEKWPKKVPPSVSELPVHQRFRVLHLLHGTGLSAGKSRTVIAYLKLHYDDGQTADLPVVYGRHVRDWWFKKESAEAPDPETEIAWVGSNRVAASQGYRLRIYRSAFLNPHPTKRVRTIDYVSTLSACAPFMLGLTLER